MRLGRLLIKFRVAVFLYWSFAATFSCYYVLFFESGKHILPSTIGMMMSAYTIATMLGQYFWGYICDKFDSIKKAFLIMAVISGGIAASFSFNNSIPLLFCAMAGLGFSLAPMSPLLDSWVIKHLGKYGLEGKLGTVRGMGSLGWALTACLTAYMINWFGWNIMYAVGSVAVVLMFLMGLFIDDVSLRPQKDKKLDQINPLAAARELFSDRAYTFIVIVMFFHFFGLQTAYNYLGLIMKTAGGSVINLGWTYLLDAGSEVPIMFLSVWLLKKYPQKKLLLIAMALYITRFALILWFRTALAVTLTSMLQGIAFGVLLTSLRNYIYLVAPEHLKTMAFTVGEACYLNLAIIAGGILGGFVVEYCGVFELVGCCMLSCLLAFVLLLVNVLYRKKTKLYR